MPRKPEPIDTDTLALIEQYRRRELTSRQAAAILGISFGLFTRKARRVGVVIGVGPGKASGCNVNALAHARALARATLRDQAIVEILGGGCEKKEFATRHDLSPTTLRSWLLAFQHELAHPTPEEQAPAEGQERDTKDWAYHAVRRLKAQYPGVFD